MVGDSAGLFADYQQLWSLGQQWKCPYMEPLRAKLLLCSHNSLIFLISLKCPNKQE